MASCQITIAGTSGEVVIKYTLSGNNITTNAFFNSLIYIDSAATNVTYTTLSGDAACSSLCVTITNLPLKYYLFQWETFEIVDKLFLQSAAYSMYDMSLNKFILGASVTTMSNNTKYNMSDWKVFADEITALDNTYLEIISGKQKMSTRNTKENYFILQVLGTDVPSLEFKNVNAGRDDFFLTLTGKLITDINLPDFILYDSPEIAL